MKNFGIRASLFLNYFVFAILLNSVGAVILQVQRNYDMSKGAASVLEAFKDLPIAIASFIVASMLPRLGIKKAMLISLAIVGAMCFVIPSFADSFWYFKMLFFTIGVTFAMVKISVFATIGLITDGTQEHSSLMSLIEGVFMIGVLFGNLFISFFIDDDNPKSEEWLNMYWFLGILSFLAFVLLYFSKLDESEARVEGNNISDDITAMFKLFVKPLILVFAISAFLFVLIEQSFQTWVPTFYNDVLGVSASMAIQAGAILAGAFAVGRLAAGFILKKVHWLSFTLICLAFISICILFNLPLTKGLSIDAASTNWFNAPLVAYLFPLMGIFLAPIYPTINSVILSALPKALHSSMSGLIVVFSALGGTTGSMLTGNVFERFDGVTAFYMSLIPIALLAICLVILHRMNRDLDGAE